MGLSVHCSAIGKAVLGSMTPAEFDALLARITLTGRTPNTITTEDRLRAEVAEVRRVGYGFDDEENEIGIRCVGAAIRDHTGAVVGGISASTLAMEHTMDQLAALGPRVLGAADTVSTALGYAPIK